jgi:hypothetical protein
MVRPAVMVSACTGGKKESRSHRGVPCGIPKKPEGLRHRAAEAWDQLVPVVDEMGVLTRVP